VEFGALLLSGAHEGKTRIKHIVTSSDSKAQNCFGITKFT
jgi:hypothetical protein